MKVELRQARLRQLLEPLPRRALNRLSRRLGATVPLTTFKDDVIDIIVAFPFSVLLDGLVADVNSTDLRRLCRQLGYSATGTPADLAARLINAVETPNARVSRWRTFEEARRFARELGLASRVEWFAFKRKDLPDDIPTAPEQAYRTSGWASWGDFLGTDNPARTLIEYRQFEHARTYARSLGLANWEEWRARAQQRIGNRRVFPADIPANPHLVYAGKGWVSMGDWLGTDHVSTSKRKFLTYAKAKVLARTHDIRSKTEWLAFRRRASPRLSQQLPSDPAKTYMSRGWTGWRDFVGGTWAKRIRTFEAARAWVWKQKLHDRKEWWAWSVAGNRPSDIPSSPSVAYRDAGWAGWRDFLGDGDRARRTRRKRRRASSGRRR